VACGYIFAAPKPLDEGVGVGGPLSPIREQRRWFARAARTFRSQDWRRGWWIPVLTNAMIFVRGRLPMMSFSIFKARL
jgi:hypothetical protein